MHPSSRAWFSGLVMLATLTGPAAPVFAQTDTPPAIPSGTMVAVVTRSGERVRGDVSASTDAAITLVVDGASRGVAFDDVERIEHRWRSGRFGAALGAGAVLAAVCVNGMCRSRKGSDDPGFAEEMALLSTGVGAAIGAAVGASVDALRKDRVLYEREPPATDGIGDGVAEGALTGLVVGAISAFSDGRGHLTYWQMTRTEAVVKGGIGMLGGAAIGGLLDRSVHQARPAAMRGGSARVIVAPVFGRAAAGGTIAIRW